MLQARRYVIRTVAVLVLVLALTTATAAATEPHDDGSVVNGPAWVSWDVAQLPDIARTSFYAEAARPDSSRVGPGGEMQITVTGPGSTSRLPIVWELGPAANAEFRWSCRHTGLHRWSIAIDGVVAEGMFRVRRCGRARALASQRAAERRAHRSCRPTGSRRGRRASAWRCGDATYRRYRIVRFGRMVGYRWSVTA